MNLWGRSRGSTLVRLGVSGENYRWSATAYCLSSFSASQQSLSLARSSAGHKLAAAKGRTVAALAISYAKEGAEILSTSLTSSSPSKGEVFSLRRPTV